tara:strand:+ start:605 stop:904 length:300 start_codon:yes stop_codon:yes gene_type:complete
MPIIPLITAFASIGKMMYEARKQREWKIQLETNQITQAQLQADLGVEQYKASELRKILAAQYEAKQAEIARGQLIIGGGAIVLLVSGMFFIVQLKKINK